MSDNTPTDWKTKVAFMRAEGLTSAKWASDGALTEAVCGPAPLPPDDNREDPAKSMSPQERERRARLDRRALTERASGGPVPRLDAELG